MNKSINSNSY